MLPFLHHFIIVSGLLALQKATQLQDRLSQLAVEKHHESKLLADAASQRSHEEGQVARLALEQQRQQQQAEQERLEEVKQVQRQRFQAAELERAAAELARR